MECKVYVIMEYLQGDEGGFPAMVFPDKESAEGTAARWNEGSQDTYTVVGVVYDGPPPIWAVKQLIGDKEVTLATFEYHEGALADDMAARQTNAYVELIT